MNEKPGFFSLFTPWQLLLLAFLAVAGFLATCALVAELISHV